MKRILVVDDNHDILDALDLLLGLHDYQVSTASTIKEAILCATNQQIDLIIQDMNFSQGTTSGDEGKSLFYQFKEIIPTTPIIVITAWGQLETAVELVKSGAADYLPKPWDDKKLLKTINEHFCMTSPQKSAHFPSSSNQLIVASQPMKQLIAMAEKVAASDISVFITGANGSGKERIADHVHQHSPRHAKPFIKVNMGALASELMEAELFGAEKGAYTGATTMRQGRFEAADGGTLFLDEIGNLPLAGQMKLLRVLQTGQFERVGSSETISVNVRVISATNADLRQAISDKTFREDLYYRLNVVELNLAPLNQRKADVLPLAKHFIGEAYQLSEEVAQLLPHQPWHGNVRELENHCKRAVVLCNDHLLLAEHFMLDNQSTPTPRLDNDKALLKSVLDKHQWVISRSADELGLSRQALYRRIEKYNLSQEQDH